MKILFDTHVLIWWVRNGARLGKHARSVILDSHTSIWISAVSIWEISIKAALGRLDLERAFATELPREMARSGFLPLTVTFEHAFAVRQLPLHHRDPFDRMLVAQARCEDLTLMTVDPKITAYKIRTLDASV